MSTKTHAASLATHPISDSEGIVHSLRDEGYAIIPGAISQDLAAETCRRIDELEFLEGDDQGNGVAVDHHKCVFNRDPFWLQFIDPPGLIEAVETLMGERCHIIGMSAWRTPPGVGDGKEGPIRVHTDQLFVPMDEELLISGRVHLPVFIATMHYYLVDISEDLCPTWVIPGSHKSGRSPGRGTYKDGYDSSRDGDEQAWNGVPIRPVLCQAGDGMLFRSEIWHAGSANRTPDRWRYLLQVHYAQRGVAQRFPPYLKFRHNPEVLAAANPRQRRMMGEHRISAYG